MWQPMALALCAQVALSGLELCFYWKQNVHFHFSKQFDSQALTELSIARKTDNLDSKQKQDARAYLEQPSPSCLGPPKVWNSSLWVAEIC